MDKLEFKRLLFDFACSAVVCDGHVDDREIRELEYIAETKPYFKDIDLKKELSNFLESYKKDPQKTIENVILQLKKNYLSQVESMLVLEVVLRLVYADTKIANKEIDFLKEVRAVLNLSNINIIERFGRIDFLLQDKSVGFQKTPKNDPLIISKTSKVDVSKLDMDKIKK